VADDSQIFGVSQEVAQVAKVAAAGGFGAVVYAYLRHPGSMLRATVLISIGVGIATIFAEPFANMSGLSDVQSGAILGLVGKGIADGVLRSIEKADFSHWLPEKKP
jgi:hypothetical protein